MIILKMLFEGLAFLLCLVALCAWIIILAP